MVTQTTYTLTGRTLIITIKSSFLIKKLLFLKLQKTIFAAFVFSKHLHIKKYLSMKKLNIVMLTALVMVLSSCDAIAGIFKAGAVVGVIAVIVVIGLILWILSLFRGRS